MKNQREEYSLVILAGGRSSRMGEDKAELMLGGKTFLTQLIDKGAHLGFDEIIISGRKTGDISIDIENQSRQKIYGVTDIYKDRGPLGGMHSALRAAKNKYCFVITVDVPQIHEKTISAILNAHEAAVLEDPQCKAVFLEHQGRREYLIGVYASSLCTEIEPLIIGEGASVRRLLNKITWKTCSLELEETEVQNINTPDVYHEVELWYHKAIEW